MRVRRVCSVLLVALASCASEGPSSGEPAATPASMMPDSPHKLVALKVLTPDVKDASERWLKEVYNSPIGTEQRMVITGRELLFVLTWHFHPPGYVGAPTGKHKGVTVFEEQPSAQSKLP